MFSCEDLRLALSDYLDGEVSPELKEHLARHLALCRTCQVLYDSTKKTLRIVTDAASFDLPESASEQFIKRTMRRISDRRGSS